MITYHKTKVVKSRFCALNIKRVPDNNIINNNINKQFSGSRSIRTEQW